MSNVALTLTAAAALTLTASTVPATAQAAGPSTATVTHTTSAEAKNRPCITRAEYVRLREGMTLTRVAQIVGTRGRIAAGDISIHTRAYTSCVAVNDERMPVCMVYKRTEKPDHTWSEPWLANKSVDCPYGV